MQLISDHLLSTSAVFFHTYTQKEDTHFVFTFNCINHLICTYSALFSFYSGVMHWTLHPCCTASLKIHLTHNKGITSHKTVADIMFKHASLHWYLCMYKQPINTPRQACRSLSPLGAFLLFSRFSQSSALPSLSATKRGEVFQDLATWRKAITLINFISIQLRSLHTQIHGSIDTITLIPVPQI